MVPFTVQSFPWEAEWASVQQVVSSGAASRLSEKSQEQKDSLTSLISVRKGRESLGGKGV